MSSRVTELRRALIAFALLACAFAIRPDIDLAVAAQFHQNGWAWLLAPDSPLVAWPYQALPHFGRLLVAVFLALWLASFVRRFAWLRAQRLLFVFLLAGAVVGPVLVVDAGLKNHVGRARPAQTEAFGGSLAFTPAFAISDQCRRNCSFVSGHVATTAFIMVFGWLGSPRLRRRWLLASLAAAAYMSLIRMSVGGHFLSDCLFAWFATYFSLWLVEFAFARAAWLDWVRGSFVAVAGFAAARVARPGGWRGRASPGGFMVSGRNG